MPDQDAFQGLTYKEAELQLRRYCNQYDVEPSPECFRRVLGKEWLSAIKALQSGAFKSQDWFESPEDRLKRSAVAFKSFLQSHKVSPRTYEKVYEHSKSDAIRLLYLGQELDKPYWLSKKRKLEKEEAYAKISELCMKHGFSLSEYQLRTRRYLKSFRKYIQAKGLYDLDAIEEAWLSVNEDPNRDPDHIRKEAAKFIEPNRTHELTQLDFGNKFKSLVKAFYPRGLAGLNSDLGLGSLTVLPVTNSSVIAEGVNPHSAHVQRLEKKLDLIHRGLNFTDRIDLFVNTDLGRI